MVVSINGGTPKWMVYNGKYHENGWFGGTPISGNLHIGIHPGGESSWKSHWTRDLRLRSNIFHSNLLESTLGRSTDPFRMASSLAHKNIQNNIMGLCLRSTVLQAHLHCTVWFFENCNMHRTLALTHSSASLWTPQSRQLGVTWKVELGTDKKVPNRNFGAACAISSSQDDVHSSYNAIPGCSCLVLPPNAGVSDKPGYAPMLLFTSQAVTSRHSHLPYRSRTCTAASWHGNSCFSWHTQGYGKLLVPGTIQAVSTGCLFISLVSCTSTSFHLRHITHSINMLWQHATTPSPEHPITLTPHQWQN